MRAATEFDGKTITHRQDANFFRIFFSKQRHGSFFLGSVNIHYFRFYGTVLSDLLIHQPFNLSQFTLAHRFKMRKVEAQFLTVNERAALIDVFAQHLS